MKRTRIHFAILGIVAIIAGVLMFTSSQQAMPNDVVSVAPYRSSVKGVSTSAQATVAIQGLEEPLTEGVENLPTNGATALDLLNYAAQKNNLELKTKDYGDMGTLVEGIGSVANGTDDKYWAYYVNGTLGQVAADQYQVKVGDAIEFRFEKSNF
ncbi:MAG: DUF4430 domain-containing protein [Patescibacteria group bacterium]